MRTCFFAAVFALAASSAAMAQTDEPFASGLYAAGGYEAWWPNYENGTGIDVPKMLNGFDADIGWRLNRYYAVEGGYCYATGSTALGLTMQEPRSMPSVICLSARAAISRSMAKRVCLSYWRRRA